MTQAKRLPPFIKELRAKIRTREKWQTRRVMKPQPPDGYAYDGYRKNPRLSKLSGHLWMNGYAMWRPPICPYGKVGDIRFLIEPLEEIKVERSGTYAAYRDDHAWVRLEEGRSMGWQWSKPYLTSIHMPTVAARTFVRLTEIRCERVQDISEEDAKAEGVTYQCFVDWMGSYKRGFAHLWDSINAVPRPVLAKVDGKKVIDHYISYPWEDVQETREHRGKPWLVCGNPYNWALSWEQYTPSKP